MRGEARSVSLAGVSLASILVLLSAGLRFRWRVLLTPQKIVDLNEGIREKLGKLIGG